MTESSTFTSGKTSFVGRNDYEDADDINIDTNIDEAFFKNLYKKYDENIKENLDNQLKDARG